MAVIAVRLRPVEKRLNFLMRTYTSARSRTKYTAGTDSNPSPFRIIKDEAEIKELSILPQFEILSFNDMDHLREFIQGEMETRARVGLPAVRAAVMNGAGVGQIVEAAPRPKKTVIDRLPPEASGVTGPRANTGRAPAQQAETVERAEVKEDIQPRPKKTGKKKSGKSTS